MLVFDRLLLMENLCGSLEEFLQKRFFLPIDPNPIELWI